MQPILKYVSFSVLVLSAFLFTASAKGFNHHCSPHGKSFHGVKNVIVLIPDGCNEAVQTATRWYKGRELNLDRMHTGDVKVHMANSIIPGSAAASTAMATGHKTTVRFLGVGPRTNDLLTDFVPTADPYAPVASILEAAKLTGKATGLVATSRITHATPAGFACHIHDRGLDNEIMEHMVYNNVDVVFGGGARHLLPSGETYTTSFGDTWQGYRTDGENLLTVLQNRGYAFVDSKDGMHAVSGGKVWGLFDDSHMEADIDRAIFYPTQPSLAEMTEKAIELLSQDRNGFFLMVEGSQVDWAGHANDPVYMVTDFLAFDDAVGVAYDFAQRDGKTLVIVLPDHNTGGMAIGQYANDDHYTAISKEELVEPLEKMKVTSTGLARFFGNYTPEDIKSAVATYWGIDLTETDMIEIMAEMPNVGPSYAVAKVVSKNYTIIGWTTHAHNAETVPLWAYGPGKPSGLIDNTEIAEYAAKVMGVSLGFMTDFLFVDVAEVTSDFTIDNDDPQNPVLKINSAEIPISKDYMHISGYKVKLPGVTVFAPMTGKVYVSKKALRMAGIRVR